MKTITIVFVAITQLLAIWANAADNEKENAGSLMAKAFLAAYSKCKDVTALKELTHSDSLSRMTPKTKAYYDKLLTRFLETAPPNDATYEVTQAARDAQAMFDLPSPPTHILSAKFTVGTPPITVVKQLPLKRDSNRLLILLPMKAFGISESSDNVK